MDLKQIERLMAAMERNGMKRIVLKQEGFEIELEKQGGNAVEYIPSIREMPFHPHPTLPTSPQEAKPHAKEPAPEVKESKYITSPMVGTFYVAPSPDDPPYVKVGQQVEAGSVVCIIEAMKVMNEVKAGMSGTVAEILLKNGDPLEFGTKMIRLT